MSIHSTKTTTEHRKPLASAVFVEDRTNTVRSAIQRAGTEVTRVQLRDLWCDPFLLNRSPHPAKQGRIKSLLDLVDHIGQTEPRTRTVKNLIDTLKVNHCISAADILIQEFELTPSYEESPEFEI